MLLKLELVTKQEIDNLERILDSTLGIHGKHRFGLPPCLEQIGKTWTGGWFFEYKQETENAEFRSRLTENAPGGRYYMELNLNLNQTNYNTFLEHCRKMAPRMYDLLQGKEEYQANP